MKPSLQLRIGQQLAMTPQLQQAIRLLQLSTLDLQQEIQAALESNPLLDLDESQEEPPAYIQEPLESKPESDEAPAVEDSRSQIDKAEISSELDIDTTWDEVYSANTGNTGIALDDELPVYQGQTSLNLNDHLLWQLELTPFSAKDRAIAIALIEAINDDGYLTQTLEQIQENFTSNDIELDEIEAVRKRIQQFDPLGVASLNLQDCLLLQLNTLALDTPWLSQAKALLLQHIELLGQRDYRQIQRETKLKEDELREVMRLIQTLNPRPGGQIGNETADYIIPDVFVFKHLGQWLVTLNHDTLPRLKVNHYYTAYAKGNTADSQYIRHHLQEAKWLIKSLESRNETLLKVAQCIVEHQQLFFDYGEEGMKPMVLNDIALAVDMHESTISRVTTQKYMHTPRGIFELKYFFSSHVGTDDGGECSSTAIRALIKKLVAAENPAKPLSDNKIVELLAEQGIQVARRTIAKYRESLGIAPSNQRKHLL